MIVEVAPTPKVGIKIYTVGDTLSRITLSLATAFNFDCSSAVVREQLLPWLKNYAAKKWSVFPLPFRAPPFSQKVAIHLQTIPFGELITYQDLAAACGSPKAARAVGNFCQGNLFPLLIPCHRVVPKSGGRGSFTPDPRIKERLLQFEEINILG